jgi:hypothetical protein
MDKKKKIKTEALNATTFQVNSGRTAPAIVWGSVVKSKTGEILNYVIGIETEDAPMGIEINPENFPAFAEVLGAMQKV